MAWPQAPQPSPTPATALPIGPIVTAAGGLLTFLFSFVQIMKADSDFSDVGLSVWTTDPGFFGVGTWIPLFALLAAVVALARGFAKGLDQKEVGGFGLLQVQAAAALFAILLWLGYMVNILLADFVTFGLGAFLLFLGLAAVGAGTVLSVLDARKGTTTTISASSGPPSGQWGAPTGPQPHSQPPGGQWPQPTPPPPPQHQPAPGQWPQPGAPVPPPPPGYPQAAAAPGQWQPDPAGAPSWPPPPGPEQAWQPPAASDPGGPAPYPAPAPAPPGPAPEPGPLDPQPAPPVDPGGPPGGALIDPGTQVIPGPPPAPPSDHVGGGPDAIPPSNTP